MARSLRADAQANYDRLLEVAARAFSREGADASLKAIAAEAGVGIGTLYRRFPTRDDLIEATYRNETTRLSESALQMLADRAPVDALREWMEQFVDYMLTKQGMADALPAILASREGLRVHSREVLVEAVATLVAAGTAAGQLRKDVAPGDVLMALGGITLISGHEHQRELASRLISLLVDGLVVSCGDASPTAQARGRAGAVTIARAATASTAAAPALDREFPRGTGNDGVPQLHRQLGHVPGQRAHDPSSIAVKCGESFTLQIAGDDAELEVSRSAPVRLDLAVVLGSPDVRYRGKRHSFAHQGACGRRTLRSSIQPMLDAYRTDVRVLPAGDITGGDNPVSSLAELVADDPVAQVQSRAGQPADGRLGADGDKDRVGLQGLAVVDAPDYTASGLEALDHPTVSEVHAMRTVQLHELLRDKRPQLPHQRR